MSKGCEDQWELFREYGDDAPVFAVGNKPNFNRIVIVGKQEGKGIFSQIKATLPKSVWAILFNWKMWIVFM
jgi:hypothetical protein